MPCGPVHAYARHGRRDTDALVERALGGDRVAIAKLLSLVEQGGDGARAVVSRARIRTRAGRGRSASPARRARASRRSPTSSSCALRADGLEVGVLAVDPTQPVQRRRDPRRPRPHAAPLDRPRRVHPLDGVARAPRRARARDAAVGARARRGRQAVDRRRDGRRRPGRGRDRGPGRHHDRGREPGLGRRGADREGGPARDRRHLRGEQGRSPRRRRDRERPRRACSSCRAGRGVAAADRAHGRDRRATASTSSGRRSRAHRAYLESTARSPKRAARPRSRPSCAALVVEQLLARGGGVPRARGSTRSSTRSRGRDAIRTRRSTSCCRRVSAHPLRCCSPTPRADRSLRPTAWSRWCRRRGRRRRARRVHRSLRARGRRRRRRGRGAHAGRRASGADVAATLVWLDERLGLEPATFDALLVPIGTGAGAPPWLRGSTARPRAGRRGARYRTRRGRLDRRRRQRRARRARALRPVGGRLRGRARRAGPGLGRRLVAAACGLVPAGEPLWAQVAPGQRGVDAFDARGRLRARRRRGAVRADVTNWS